VEWSVSGLSGLSGSPEVLAVIMAGGWGQRLWPLSTPSRPKPLLRLGPGPSLLADAVGHASLLAPSDHVYVAASADVADAVSEAQVGVPDARILVEPAKRDTLGCLAYVLAWLDARGLVSPVGPVLALLTSDHVIRDVEAFRHTASRACELARGTGQPVLIGVPPRRPEVGFGYLEVEPGPEPRRMAVRRFHEKPSPDQAEVYLRSGRFLWNSGMLFCRIGALRERIRQRLPDLGVAIDRMADAWRQGSRDVVADAFMGIPATSIDYALLEGWSDLLAVAGEFGWDNINGWDAVCRLYPADDAGNVVRGSATVSDCRNCLVISDGAVGAPAATVVGMEAAVVVVSGGRVLVCPRGREFRVPQGQSPIPDPGGH